jgi:hypothetical protein
MSENELVSECQKYELPVREKHDNIQTLLNYINNVEGQQTSKEPEWSTLGLKRKKQTKDDESLIQSFKVKQQAALSEIFASAETPKRQIDN